MPQGSNYEDIISKRIEARYRSEHNEGWLKIKTVQRGIFPVVVKDPSGVATLCLGKREGKEPVSMGKVGAASDRTTSGKMRKASLWLF